MNKLVLESELTAVVFFFFNAPATTDIYTLSLHDALPIWRPTSSITYDPTAPDMSIHSTGHSDDRRRSLYRCADRKSTRLNSSHVRISYAVFCLKKKIQCYRNILEH